MSMYRKGFLHGWCGMAALVLLLVALGLGGCALSVPLTPGQEELAKRQRAAQGVLYCEVFAGRRDCKRISREDVGRILQGGP